MEHGRLDWLEALGREWDTLAFDDATWRASGCSAGLADAFQGIKGLYHGRAVATKLLHLKRPALVPVCDSFVEWQLGARSSMDLVELVEYIRSQGRRNLTELLAVQASLASRGVDRTLVRVFDALLSVYPPQFRTRPRSAPAQRLGGKGRCRLGPERGLGRGARPGRLAVDLREARWPAQPEGGGSRDAAIGVGFGYAARPRGVADPVPPGGAVRGGGVEVNVTKLQKILYLADLEHFNDTGTTLTGARWVRYTHGPMAKALVPSTNMMDGHEVTVSVEQAGQYEAKIYRPGPAPRFRPGLTAEERATLDRIVALARSMTSSKGIPFTDRFAVLMTEGRQQGYKKEKTRENIVVFFLVHPAASSTAATHTSSIETAEVRAAKKSTAKKAIAKNCPARHKGERYRERGGKRPRPRQSEKARMKRR